MYFYISRSFRFLDMEIKSKEDTVRGKRGHEEARDINDVVKI
jgi:hypothetical protein